MTFTRTSTRDHQEPPTSENRLHGAWYPCGCKLPAGCFRRGTHHFYTKDGKDYAYERCAPSTAKAQQRAMRRQRETTTAKGAKL